MSADIIGLAAFTRDADFLPVAKERFFYVDVFVA